MNTGKNFKMIENLHSGGTKNFNFLSIFNKTLYSSIFVGGLVGFSYFANSTFSSKLVENVDLENRVQVLVAQSYFEKNPNEIKNIVDDEDNLRKLYSIVSDLGVLNEVKLLEEDSDDDLNRIKFSDELNKSYIVDFSLDLDDLSVISGTKLIYDDDLKQIYQINNENNKLELILKDINYKPTFSNGIVYFQQDNDLFKSNYLQNGNLGKIELVEPCGKLYLDKSDDMKCYFKKIDGTNNFAYLKDIGNPVNIVLDELGNKVTKPTKLSKLVQELYRFDLYFPIELSYNQELNTLFTNGNGRSDLLFGLKISDDLKNFNEIDLSDVYSNLDNKKLRTFDVDLDGDLDLVTLEDTILGFEFQVLENVDGKLKNNYDISTLDKELKLFNNDDLFNRYLTTEKPLFFSKTNQLKTFLLDKYNLNSGGDLK